MQSLPSFNPSSIAQAIAGIIFYLAVIAVTFFSASTIYSLLKFSKSRGLGFIVSVVYMIIFLVILSSGIEILNSIK